MDRLRAMTDIIWALEMHADDRAGENGSTEVLALARKLAQHLLDPRDLTEGDAMAWAAKLRNNGYAVCLFYPDEFKGIATIREMESAMHQGAERLIDDAVVWGTDDPPDIDVEPEDHFIGLTSDPVDDAPVSYGPDYWRNENGEPQIG